MEWCRCKKCGHKLFQYDETKANENNNLEINIKCSSCKEILDVVVLDKKVDTVIRRDTCNATAGRKVDNKEVTATCDGGNDGGEG